MAVIEPHVHRDGRGFFVETYRAERLAETGIAEEWVQDNHSRSVRGVVRGMHFSVGAGQAKLIRCARGAIVDVAVDIRQGSPTFGRWDAVRLLVEQGFDVNASGGITALHYAAAAGDAAIIQLLLDHGADPTIRDAEFDQRPPEWARFFGQDDVLKYLE